MSVVISTKESDIEVSFLGRTIIIPQDEKKRQLLMEKVNNCAQNIANQYANDLLPICQNFDALYKDGLSSLPVWLDRIPDIGLRLLEEYAITDVARSTISDMLSNVCQCEAERTFNRYTDAARYLANYIEDRYNHRIEIPDISWNGGGFSVAGAIKGTLTASAMNLASSILVSAGQAAIDIKITSDIEHKKSEILMDWKLDTYLYDAVYRSTQGLRSIIEQLLISHHLLSNGSITQSEKGTIFKEARKNKELYNRTKSINDRERAVDCWIQLIQCSPTEVVAYSSICRLFEGTPQFSEVKRDLDKLTEFYGIQKEYKQYLVLDIRSERVGCTWFKPETTAQEIQWKINQLTEVKNLYPEFSDHPELKVNADLQRLQRKLDVLQKRSTASSSTGAAGESSCFITSAVCRTFNKLDDCYELTAFRSFRDSWLAKQPDGQALIQEYYKVAPAIVECIDQKENCKDIYQSIWNTYLMPCLLYIETQQFNECKNTYVTMVNALKQKYSQKA